MKIYSPQQGWHVINEGIRDTITGWNSMRYKFAVAHLRELLSVISDIELSQWLENNLPRLNREKLPGLLQGQRSKLFPFMRVAEKWKSDPTSFSGYVADSGPIRDERHALNRLKYAIRKLNEHKV